MGQDRSGDPRLLSPDPRNLSLIVGVDGRELEGAPTGAGRYLRSLLASWPEAKDVILLYLREDVALDIRSPATIHPRVLGRQRGTSFLEFALPRASRADGIDVFFAPGYFCPPRLPVAGVTAIHDLACFSYPQDFAFWEGLRRRLLVRRSVRISRKIVACSDFTAREILSHFPDAQGRLLTLPLGSPFGSPPPREEARRRLEVVGPYLLTVGSIFRRRHPRELLRAVQLLVPSYRELRLDIIGDNRTSLDLYRFIAELGLENHVRLRGFVSESALAEAYAAADVCVYLSDYEGFGLPALEALTYGVPLVTSTAPALGELFGEASLLVDPRDIRGISEALSRLLGDESLRENQATRGRHLASRFSWTDAARQTREALSSATRP